MRRLFREGFGSGLANFDVSRDGRQFYFAEPVTNGPQPAIRVVLNWYEEFRDRRD